MDIKNVIQNFYNGLTQKNNDWQRDIADDVVFSDASKKLLAHGKEEFVKSFQTFLRDVEKVEMKQLIVEGENACAIVSYNYLNPKGERMHQDDAEVWKVVDGKIVALTIYFDITEFRNFMRGN